MTLFINITNILKICLCSVLEKNDKILVFLRILADMLS